MTPQAEVALFIDFENIRYSLLNLYGQEPDPQQLMERARNYGPVAVAYAYADFAQQPAVYRRKLEVAGISTRDVPRRSPDVVDKSSADMAMLMDIIDCLLDSQKVQTLVLMTGDSDFIRVTARARHRFGKRVIISGVPGSVSADLIESADAYDPLVDPRPTRGGNAALSEEPDGKRLLQLVLWLEDHRPYMTFGFIRSHALSPHHGLGLNEAQVTELLSRFKTEGILTEGSREGRDDRTLRTLALNPEHSAVIACLEEGLPVFEDNPVSAPSATGKAVGGNIAGRGPSSREPAAPADAHSTQEEPSEPETGDGREANHRDEGAGDAGELVEPELGEAESETGSSNSGALEPATDELGTRF